MLEECRQLKAGAEARLRIALLNVDYVTSFELPFLLLLLRTPQLIAGLRDELQVSQKNVIFNGKRYGCVWSLKADRARCLMRSSTAWSPTSGVWTRMVLRQPLFCR